MIRSLLVLNLLLFLSGCMVGPDYEPPVVLMPTSFIEDQTEENGAADCELAAWWQVFNDPFLEELLEESLERNYDFKIALEKICQARAAFWVQCANILPELDADAQAVRTRSSQNLVRNAFAPIAPIQSFYQADLDVLWQIDLFGGLRRAARGANDTYQATVEEARGVRIMLLSDVATTYTLISALQHTADIDFQKMRLDEELLEMAVTRFESGISSEQEVENARATLDADKAALLEIETNVKQAIYSLSVLLSRSPESLLADFEEIRAIPTAIGTIPIGLPADLLRRRPDIRSAERQIAAATEEIGVAVADLFPKFALTGSSGSFSANPLQGTNYGFASNTFKNWFTSPSRLWGFGSLMTWPLFDFGKRIAAIEVQDSIAYQKLYAYEKTVITALEEVESSLIAYFNEEKSVLSITDEVAANQRTYDLTADLYQAGLASYSESLSAKEILLTSMRSLTVERKNLALDLITLYKALGGGWEGPCCSTP